MRGFDMLESLGSWLQAAHNAAAGYFAAIEVSTYATFCSAIAALHGALLAGVLAVDLLVIQHTAASYAPTFIDDLRRSKRTKMERAYLGTALGLAIAGVFLAPNLRLDAVLANAGLAVVSFCILLSNLERAYRWLNPLGLLEEIAQEGSGAIAALKRAIERKKRMPHREKLLRDLFQRRVEQTLDFLARAIDQGRFSVFRRSLTTILDLVRAYSTVSRGEPRSSDTFLNEVLEFFDEVTDKSIARGDKEAARQMMQAFGEIGRAALLIEPDRVPSPGGHPLAGLPAGYIEKKSTRAVMMGMEDVAMEAATQLTNHAQLLFQEGHHTTALVVVDKLVLLGRISAARGLQVATNYCNSGVMAILLRLCSSVEFGSLSATLVRDKAMDFTLFLLGKEGLVFLGEPTVAPSVSVLWKASFANCATTLARRLTKLEQGLEGKRVPNRALEDVRRLVLVLRACGEQAAKTDAMVTVYLVQSLEMVALELVGHALGNEDKLQVECTWALGSFGFIAHAVESSRSVVWHTIEEALCRIAVRAMQRKQWKTLERVISEFVIAAEYSLQKDGWGSGPNLMVNACLISCILYQERRTGQVLHELLRSFRRIKPARVESERRWTDDVENKLYEIQTRSRIPPRLSVRFQEDALREAVHRDTLRMLRRAFFRRGVWAYTLGQRSYYPHS